MKLELSDNNSQSLDVRRGDLVVARYQYAPQMAQLESPRPFLHPVRTLKGNLVTAFRPHDHIWHKGISLTSAELSGANFWGGVTWVRGEGYKQLANNGSQQHRSWKKRETGEESATLVHELHWKTQAGQTWLHEERALTVDTSSAAENYWTLGFNFHLHNVRGEPLVWGSPTTVGRPDAGYGGLFWRGPRDFQGGKILIEKGDGPDSMGKRSPWLAYLGTHDETSERTTMLFLDSSQNLRHPVQWFVRNTVTAVAAAWTFDQEYVQRPDEMLNLNYHIVIADGEWKRDRIESIARKFATR